MLNNEKEKHQNKNFTVRQPGVEPGSTAWEAAMITVTPLAPTIYLGEFLRHLKQ